MPTLMTVHVPHNDDDGEDDYGDETAGETAHMSDVEWISNEFADRRASGGCVADESTLSGSFLTAALEDMRKNANKNDENDQESVGDVTMSQQSTEEITNVSRKLETTVHGDDDDDASTTTSVLSDDDETMNVSYRMPFRQFKVNSQKMGPNEKKYLANYREFVTTKVRDFERQRPNELRNYRTMDLAGKDQAQHQVTRLLDRLGISNRVAGADDGTCSLGEGTVGLMDDDHETEDRRDQSASFDMQNDDTVDESIALLSHGEHSLSVVDTSIALLSPQAAHSPTIETCVALLTPVNRNQIPRSAKVVSSPTFSDDSSNQSIEIPRAARPFESPNAVMFRQKKRLASMSGKRGADVARARQNDNTCTSLDSPDCTNSPSRTLDTSMRRLSLAPDKMMFTASQSPIMMDDHDRSSDSDDFVQADISFGDEELERTPPPATYSTIDSMNDTRDRRVHWGTDQQQLSGRVGLKSGATFHLKPLQTKPLRKQRREAPTQAFPDPFDFYNGRIAHRLAKMFKWLRHRDESSERSGADPTGVLLNLAERQIFDLVLKLLLEVSLPSEQSLQSQGSFDANERIAGKTLIVARTKEDLEAWAQILREGCSLSVLNHAVLPMKQRKTQHTAKTCANYDVVLTTFDALKSADVTMILNDEGFVLNGNVVSEGGWFTSRSASQSSAIQQHKQLSVLHRLDWRRVVFVDILGQKCYLAKHETARAEASRALNAKARFIFFVESNEKGDALTALAKSNKKALKSVGAVLRLEDHDAEEALVTGVLIDFRVEEA